MHPAKLLALSHSLPPILIPGRIIDQPGAHSSILPLDHRHAGTVVFRGHEQAGGAQVREPAPDRLGRTGLVFEQWADMTGDRRLLGAVELADSVRAKMIEPMSRFYL